MSTTDRIERLRQNYVNSKPVICYERARIFTESHKRTEGQPIPIRRAQAFYDFCNEFEVRIFEDEQGKTNLSLADVDGGLLLVSQFTLYANCKRGNRPSFIEAGKPDMANEMYEYIIEKCRESVDEVQTGEFGADMKVQLLNDGPFTILLDSDQL